MSIASGVDIQALQDRVDIIEVLNTYSSSVDKFDKAGVRSALADDIEGTYGNAPTVIGGDKLADWIYDATAGAGCLWQHHLVNVYHVDIDGDSAKTLSYLTSYQVFEANPDSAVILVARYHDELSARRTAGRSPSARWRSSGASSAPRTASWIPSVAPVPRLVEGLVMAIVRLQGTMTCDAADLPKAEAIFEQFIAKVEADEPGVVTYHYFVDEDPCVIHVIEEFATPEAMVDHYTSLDVAKVGELLEIVQLGDSHYFGDPTPAEQEILAGFGTVHYHKPLTSINRERV